jgi:type I restriction enzyme S subunit
VTFRFEPVQLRHLVTCLDGRRVPLNGEQRSEIPGPYPYWGANGVVDHVERPIFNETLILLGEDGAPFFEHGQDVAFLVNEPIWVNNHIHALRPRNVNPRFLTYALNAVDYAQYITGSTRDKLTQEDMRRIEIRLPDQGEQRRIADFLDDKTSRFDAIRQARSRQLALLRERREAIVGAIVGIGSKEQIELRRAGVSVTTGPFGTVFSAADYVFGGVPMINPVHIKGGVIEPDDQDTVSLHMAGTRLRRHQLRAGDLVVGRKRDIGRAALVQPDQDGWICGSDCIALHVGGSRLEPRFLACLLSLSDVRRQLLEKSTSATSMPTLSEGNLLQLRVPVPDLSVQRRLVENVGSVDASTRSLVTAMERQIVLADERRQALIMAAVTGQIDVTTAGGVG